MIYKYKFHKIAKAVTVLIILLSLAFAVWSVVAFVNGSELVALITSLILNAVVIAFAIKLFYSSYIINEDGVEISISFLKLKIDLKDIFNVKYFKTENVLVLYYFKGNLVKQHFLQLDEEFYSDFVKDLRLQKPQILYEEIV